MREWWISHWNLLNEPKDWIKCIRILTYNFLFRVFRSLHNTIVKMSEEVVLFIFYTFFIDVKVANLSEVKLYMIMI